MSEAAATGGGDAAGPERQGIQSIEVAMRVIRAVEDARGPVSLTQIAAASGMSTSKAHRYLVSLARVGMIAQVQRAGLYDFGPAMRRLGIEAMRRMDEVGIAAEHLPLLRDATSHSVNLSVWGDDGPVVVHWEHGAHALPMNVRIGSTLPLLDSSAGRVFLAHLPEAMTLPVLAEASRDGRVSAEDRAKVADIRAGVLGRGVAITFGSVMSGLAAVAAPVVPGDGLLFAISVALPVKLADEPALEAIRTALLETTSAIGAALGGPSRD